MFEYVFGYQPIISLGMPIKNQQALRGLNNLIPPVEEVFVYHQKKNGLLKEGMDLPSSTVGI